MSMIYFLMGKSASGKNHIAEALLEDKDLALEPIVLYTTRPMRATEIDGYDYHFITDREEEAFMKAGKIIEERVYNTVKGDWKYFTADDGTFDKLKEGKRLFVIGTLEAYERYRDYFGEDRICPIYIDVNDATLIERSVRRENKQNDPDFEEVYRRFKADRSDFAPEKLARINKLHRFTNNGNLEDCIRNIKEKIF